MFKRAFRLTDNKDFQTVYRRGRYNATALFSVNSLANHTATTKIGIVVNKKVSKKAVERNAIKRQVREVMRSHLTNLQKGQSIVITVRKPALGASYATIEKDVTTSLKRLGLIIEAATKDN